MGKQSFSVKTLLNERFEVLPISEEWVRIIGEPPRNFNLIVWGQSGSGKTTFVLKLISELQKFGKVYYNSIEQGFSKSLQDNISRTDLGENANIMFGDRDNYEEMVLKIKTNKAQFVVIDSIQYLNLGKRQYEEIKKLFPKKAFIFISHEKAQEPKGETAKYIRYDVDIKARIQKGVTNIESRYGHTEPYQIFKNAFLNSLKTDLNLGF